jgi:hypothetical protein
MFGPSQNLEKIGEVLYPGYIGKESFDAVKPGAQPWIATARNIAAQDQPLATALLMIYGPEGGRFGNLNQQPVETPFGKIFPYHDDVEGHTLRAMLLTYAAQFDAAEQLVVTPAEAQHVANTFILSHDIMEAVMVKRLGLGTDVSRVDAAEKATRMADIFTKLKPLGLQAKHIEFALAGENLPEDIVYRLLLFQRATDFANRRSAPDSLARTDLAMLGRLSPEQKILMAEQIREGGIGDPITSVERLIASNKRNPNRHPKTTCRLYGRIFLNPPKAI